MSIEKSEVFQALVNLVEKNGLQYVIDNLAKAKQEADRTKKVVLKAVYKVSGLTYTDTVEIDEDESKYGDYWLKELMRVVTDNIKKLEKTSMGILDINLNLTLTKGAANISVGNITLVRDWIVEESVFLTAKQSLATNYERIKGVKS